MILATVFGLGCGILGYIIGRHERPSSAWREMQRLELPGKRRHMRNGTEKGQP